MTSRFVTPELARAAVALQLPAIEAALRRPEISGLGVLHLVVMDPARPSSAGGAFDDALLFEQSIGDRARWDVDYAAYARDKARLSWRHARDSRRLQLLEPHRLLEGDSLLWGGVWLDGIVVAASGAQAIWDETFALGVAASLRALAWEAAERARRAA